MVDKKDGYCLGCESGVDADDAHKCEDGKYHPDCDLSPAKSERRRAATNIQRTIRGKIVRKKFKKPTKKATNNNFFILINFNTSEYSTMIRQI